MEAQTPWYERLPLIGNLGWPIAQKEVRSLIRRNRYFWSQFVYLAFLSLGVIIIVTGSQGMTTQQEAIGQRLFGIFFLLQGFLVALVFPAFAATSFSAERSERSWELLITTDLRPYELVWGKFIGIFGNCCYFLLVTLPLLGVCILFGGVSIADALENYLLLLIEAALLCIYGIWVSSCTSSNIRAIMTTYAPILVFGWAPVGFFTAARSTSGGAQGFFSFFFARMPGMQDILLATFVYVVVACFAFCFISAVLRLSSPESNQETPLRVFAVVAAGFGLLLATWGILTVQGAPGWQAQDGLSILSTLGMAVGFILPIAVLAFAGGRSETPLRTARRAAREPWLARLAWILLPGGIRGYAFTVVFVGLVYGGLYWIAAGPIGLASLPVPQHLQGIGADRLEVSSSAYGLLVVGFLGYGGFSFFLSTLGVRGFLNWAIVLASGVLASLLAVVYWVQVEPEPGTLSAFFGTSIVVTLMTYLDPATSEPWLVHFSMLTHAAGGVLCAIAGLVALHYRGIPAWKIARPRMRAFPTAPKPSAVEQN